MKYILIGQLLGTIVTSEHDTREACEGRAVLLREKGASVQCVQSQISGFPTWGGSNAYCIRGDGQAVKCGQ